MNGNIKVVIADDHELYRDGLKLMLTNTENIEVVGQAKDGHTLIQVVNDVVPDVVITDIKMPIIDGIEATKIILRNNPGVQIIGLSMFADDELIIGMIEAGAVGYLLKNVDKTEVLDAIYSVLKDQHYYCKEIVPKIAKIKANTINRRQWLKSIPNFTEREKKIIVCICDGLTNKEIGSKLSMSYRTIEGIRTHIMDKIGVTNSAGLIIAAMQYNLYKPKN